MKKNEIEYVGNCSIKDRWRMVRITLIVKDEKGAYSVEDFLQESKLTIEDYLEIAQVNCL